jgi:hypothetical protein
MIFVNLERVVITVITYRRNHVFVSIHVINKKYRTEGINNGEFFGVRKMLNSTAIYTGSYVCV